MLIRNTFQLIYVIKKIVSKNMLEVFGREYSQNFVFLTISLLKVLFLSTIL